MARARAGSGFLLARPATKYELACRACGRTWADETPAFMLQKHMREEHDRNDIELVLRRQVVN